MVTILAIRGLSVQEPGFLPLFYLLLVQGVPGFLRTSLEETRSLDEDSSGISYTRNTKTIDHLFLPRPYSVKGIAHCVIFEDNDNFIVPDFVVYENSHGYERVIGVPSAPQKTMFSHVTQSYSSSVQSTTPHPLLRPFLLVYSAEPLVYASTSTSSSYGYGVDINFEEVRYSSSYQQGDNSLSYQAQRLVDLHTTYSPFDNSYATVSPTSLSVLPHKTNSLDNTLVIFHPHVQDNQKQQYYKSFTAIDGAQATTAVPFVMTYLPDVLSSIQTDITEPVLAQFTFLPAIESALKTSEVLLVPVIQDAAPENYFSLTAVFDDKQVMDSVLGKTHSEVSSPETYNVEVRSKQLIDSLPPSTESSLKFTSLPSRPVQTPHVPALIQTYETSIAYVPSLADDRTSATIDMVVQEVSQLTNNVSLKQVVRDGKALAGIQTLFDNYVINQHHLQNNAKTYVLHAFNADAQEQQAYFVAENSLLALVDKYLYSLGVENVSYEIHTFTVQGKKLQKVLLKDVNSILGKEYDELKRGFAIFVNGEEPGNGTLNLEDYAVKAGDLVSLAVIDQQTYRGNFSGEKDLATRCLSSTELVNAAIAYEGLHDHFGLREFHKDGKTLEGILTMIDNYTVKRSDLCSDKSYFITVTIDPKTGSKKQVELASNSALAVIDKLLGQLGANPQYKLTTFAAGGKIHKDVVEFRGIFEYDKGALAHFGVSTNAYVGMLGFVNGEEPELGTKPLHEITVSESDKVSLAYVHQGVYNGGYGKSTSSSVCLGITVATRAAQLGMQSVFAEQDTVVSGKRALGVVNHYVVQEQDIVLRQKEYAVNVIVNDKTNQVTVAGDSVLAVIDQMIYRNKIGLNMDTRFNNSGQVYVRGVFERDQTAQQKLGNYDVKAVVDGKVVDDLVATHVKVGQDVSLVYVRK